MFYNDIERQVNMKKDLEKEEIAKSFRKYARFGLDREGLDPLRVLRVIDVCFASQKNKLDMLAVLDTMRLLELNGEGECASAVRAVYFATATHRLAKNEITRRIRRHATENYCDERTVYRRLARAKELYLKVRAKENSIVFDL